MWAAAALVRVRAMNKGAHTMCDTTTMRNKARMRTTMRVKSCTRARACVNDTEEGNYASDPMHRPTRTSMTRMNACGLVCRRVCGGEAYRGHGVCERASL